MKIPKVDSLPVAYFNLARGRDLLLIGSEAMLDRLIAGFRDRRLVRPRAYTSYAIPPATLLAGAAAIFVL